MRREESEGDGGPSSTTRQSSLIARRLRAAHLHQPGGWLSPGYLEVDGAGTITRVSGAMPEGWDEASIEQMDGYVLPGMINLHSHAHQRGLTGRAEGGSGATEAENFWAWRERMYGFANSLTPDTFEAIAGQAYLEMLKAGFTTVGEFHYLHHDRDGRPYDNPAEMSERVLAAADTTGIALTVLPVLYTRAGIGTPPALEQRRFVLDLDAFADLLQSLTSRIANLRLMRLGVAPHSIRAVSTDELVHVPELAVTLGSDTPVHIHVAEQMREVEECLAGIGARPAEWLLEHLPLASGWTFIHATHTDERERQGMAERRVVAGLCPLTEANLGDGLFALTDYAGRAGAWGIGSDSDNRISVAEELRLLEYGQRLFHRRRSILVRPGDPTTERPGRVLYDHALAGGAQSLVQPVGSISPGNRADLIELDPNHPILAGQSPETILDAWIFAGSNDVVRNVMIGGHWVVRDRHHEREDEIVERFRRAMREFRVGSAES